MDVGKPGAHEIMENNTLFDLNEALGEWRQRMANAPAFTPENLRELEAHLKDSMVKLQSAGLSVEESFQIATRRLGSIETLENEFGKVNVERVWLERAFWMLAGLQVYVLASSLARVAAQAMPGIGLPSLVQNDSERSGKCCLRS